MLWNGQRDLRGWRHGELKASLCHQVCTYENEGCCLPRISFKYRSLLDLLRGSERSSWAHRSNRVHILRDDGPGAASALYHCALLAERPATGYDARYRIGKLPSP